MNTAPRAAQPDAALSRALRSSLDLPLSALRASLESLARELGPDPRSAGIDQALSEVSRAGRVVSDLADYASEPGPMPLSCSVDEILYTARIRLSRGERERVEVANSLRGLRILVDGLLLARALERLLQNAVEASDGRVLITARRAAEGEALLQFNVLNDFGDEELDAEWARQPFHTHRPQHLGLGLTLAARDVELLGGSLELARTPRGEVVATVSLLCSEIRRPSAEI